jgi:hypothetical protein
MKRIVRLTESDLARIVKRVIREQEELFDKSEMSNLVNKTVNIYSGPSERQNEFVMNAKISAIEYVESGTKPGINIVLTSESEYGESDLFFQCGVNNFTYKQKPMFNKQLMSTIKESGFCQTMRDKKGNLKNVPNADFASTGGNMGGMA